MKALKIGRSTLIICLGFAVLGCEYRRDQNVRRNAGNSAQPDPSAVATDDVDASLVKTHHAGGRRPAALSDEAREIEGHFNVR